MAAILKERAIQRLKKALTDDNGLPTMSKEAILLACIENDGYENPELNEKLFLHFKGKPQSAAVTATSVCRLFLRLGRKSCAFYFPALTNLAPLPSSS